MLSRLCDRTAATLPSRLRLGVIAGSPTQPVTKGDADLWRGCVEGDPKSWETMRRYGKQDTALLERVYHRLKSWAPNHPDINLYKEYRDRVGCPTCGSEDTQRRGTAVKLAAKYYRFHCQSCGAWFSGKKI